jgi:hypothetical protein
MVTLLRKLAKMFRIFSRKTMGVNDAAVAVPKYDIDKILYTNSVTLDVTNSVGTQNFTLPIGNINGTDIVPVGILSYDSGTSWSDCIQGLTVSTFTIQKNVSVRFTPSATSINAQVVTRATVGSGTTYPLIIKYALIAKSTVTTSAEGTFSGNGAAYSSKASYMKIFTQGQTSVGAGFTTTTIPHNLGYEPVVNVFFNGEPAYTIASPTVFSTGIVPDTSNLLIYTNAATTIDYIIYYEPVQ